MSKKNLKYHSKKDNGYPLPERTVLYDNKKQLQPIPEVGKRYHCFDDGKIRFSRDYVMKVKEVLNYMEFKRKYPKLFKTYVIEAKQHYWIYSRRTDKFIVLEPEENRTEYNNIEIAVRTKDGGWFTFSNSALCCGTLDVTGELWDDLVKIIDKFDYTQEEKEKLIREGNLT